jgi:hypothetical protein
MAITNGYCTLSDLKTYIGLTGSGQDTNIENSITSASREIDQYCGRIFYVTSSSVRQYTPINRYELEVDDISSTTGLVVKLDTTDDGSYDKTLTINTDFIVTPVNRTDTLDQNQPIMMLKILEKRSSERFDTDIINNVQITATYGFSSVPSAIKQATLLQATRLFKRKDAPFSTYGNAQTGTAELFNRFDPDALKLIKGYKKHRL